MGEKVVGILNDVAIRQEIAENELVRFHTESSIKASSYDMAVGTIFKGGEIINPGGQKENIQITIKPGEIISLFTKEELNLPDDIVATAFAINELSSQGILVLNPGHVDPGFDGPLTVRAINVRQTPKAITTGTDIFTVVFERLPIKVGKEFDRNTDRKKREQKFSATDVEQNPGSLADLVFKHGKPEHIVDEAKVKSLIQENALVRFNTFLSGLAAFAGVAALIFAMFQVWGGSNGNKTSESGSARVATQTPLPTPSPEQNNNSNVSTVNAKSKNGNR